MDVVVGLALLDYLSVQRYSFSVGVICWRYDRLQILANRYALKEVKKILFLRVTRFN
jgi:hypothetical protein